MDYVRIYSSDEVADLRKSFGNRIPKVEAAL
jgi:hypothetical protein